MRTAKTSTAIAEIIVFVNEKSCKVLLLTMVMIDNKALKGAGQIDNKALKGAGQIDNKALKGASVRIFISYG